MIVACLSFAATNTAQAQRLEIDRMPSFRRGIRADTVVPGEHSLNGPDDERHKLNCMAAVRQREGKEDVKASKVTVRSNFALSQWGDRNSCMSVKLHYLLKSRLDNKDRAASILALKQVMRELL